MWDPGPVVRGAERVWCPCPGGQGGAEHRAEKTTRAPHPQSTPSAEGAGGRRVSSSWPRAPDPRPPAAPLRPNSSSGCTRRRPPTSFRHLLAGRVFEDTFLGRVVSAGRPRPSALLCPAVFCSGHHSVSTARRRHSMLRVLSQLLPGEAACGRGQAAGPLGSPRVARRLASLQNRRPPFSGLPCASGFVVGAGFGQQRRLQGPGRGESGVRIPLAPAQRDWSRQWPCPSPEATVPARCAPSRGWSPHRVRLQPGRRLLPWLVPGLSLPVHCFSLPRLCEPPPRSPRKCVPLLQGPGPPLAAPPPQSGPWASAIGRTCGFVRSAQSPASHSDGVGICAFRRPGDP